MIKKTTKHYFNKPKVIALAKEAILEIPDLPQMPKRGKMDCKNIIANDIDELNKKFTHEIHRKFVDAHLALYIDWMVNEYETGNYFKN